jgi:hypothetical protein
MGREIRMVPANWQHPKEMRYDHLLGREVETYKPLHDDRATALQSFAADIEKKGLAEAIDYHGGGPQSCRYVDFEGQEPTWFQVYETVSEGTPVTPPFETQEELVEYLVANGDFWDQQRRSEGRSVIPCEPWSRKQAESFVYGGGWAPSLVVDNGRVMSGVEAMAEMTDFKKESQQPEI